MDSITIYTTGDAAEDLRTLCERIRGGDTPSTKELLAILENCVEMMDGEKTTE